MRALLATGGAMAALLLSGSVVVAYGEVPPPLIDPECEPERALTADPALVALPDGACPADYVSPEPAPGEQPPATPAEPAPVAAPAPPPAPQLLPPERPEPPEKQATRRRPPQLKAEQHVDSGGAEAPAKPRRARRKPTAEQPSSGGVAAPDAHAPAVVPTRSGAPEFLMPIYRSASRRYGIPWEILAAINEIETGYGANLNVSSAGAEGWMQFMPSTWDAHGVDASGDGVANPYDPVDAIHSAAAYLSAAGWAEDKRGALFAYNHANWYVDWVLARAELIAAGGLTVLPDPLRRARRLHPDFAARLALVAGRAGVPWELTLAVLRVRGHRGRVPATAAELRALTRRLVSLGARRDPRGAVHDLTGDRPLRARRIVALAHYHRAVGLRGLVRGLEHVKRPLARRVLKSKRLDIYAGGREDIRRGVTDVRVLVLLRYLASRYSEVTVTSLTTGHSFLTASGNVSAHSYGRAIDIAALNGTPILGHQAPGGLTERALWNVLLLPAELRPRELISLFELGGPSFALADHADHIHIGY